MKYSIWGLPDAPHTLAPGDDTPRFSNGTRMPDCERRFLIFESQTPGRATDVYDRYRAAFSDALCYEPLLASITLFVLGGRDVDAESPTPFIWCDRWTSEKAMTLDFPKWADKLSVDPASYAVFSNSAADMPEAARKLETISSRMPQHGWKLLDAQIKVALSPTRT